VVYIREKECDFAMQQQEPTTFAFCPLQLLIPCNKKERDQVVNMEESWWLTMIGFLLGLMFLFSGFLVNALQVLSVLLFLPFSRKAYRLANIMLMESLWSELVWLLDWWAGVKVLFSSSLSAT
jgi:lysophosphatidic acid acyltransferase/lysophosphatidylinositol acyltransferase